MFADQNYNEFYNEYLKKRFNTNGVMERLKAKDDFHDYLSKKNIKSVSDILQKEIDGYLGEKEAQNENTKETRKFLGSYKSFIENVVRAGMFYPKGVIPEIITFQIQLDEFLFLGKEYTRSADMKKVWDDFIGASGYEMNKKRGKNTRMPAWLYGVIKALIFIHIAPA